MFDDIRYRWALQKYLKQHRVLYRAYDELPPDPGELSDGEPHPKLAMGREVNYSEQWISMFRSKYLVEQSFLYNVPLPESENDWIQPRGAPERFLTIAAAHKLHSDIRAVQKADWDYWANRVTLGLALVGSIFGVLAFLKK
jgi:hypothetical protein